MYKAFITGIEGFIGFHLAMRLTKIGFAVYGCDNEHPSYDPSLKELRKKELEKAGVEIVSCDILEIESLRELFIKHNFSHLFHLAALSSSRESHRCATHMGEDNIMGFIRVLECAKQFPDMKVLFASSCAVYGQKTIPFEESDPICRPLNVYGAMKASSEIIAHSYHQSYGMDVTILRCFNVYGPYGRPDRPPYLFAKAIVEKQPITLFKCAELKRDFIYIDDAIDGFISAMDLSGFQVINIGSGETIGIESFLGIIEKEMGTRTEVILHALPPAEIIETRADISRAKELLDFAPKIPIEEGLHRFIHWFKGRYCQKGKS